MPSILKKLRGIDLYGRPVNLRFDENDYFKTKCGLYSTLVLFTVTMIIFGFEFFNMVRGKVKGVSSEILHMTKDHFSKSQKWSDNFVFGYAFDS